MNFWFCFCLDIGIDSYAPGWSWGMWNRWFVFTFRKCKWVIDVIKSFTVIQLITVIYVLLFPPSSLDLKWIVLNDLDFEDHLSGLTQDPYEFIILGSERYWQLMWASDGIESCFKSLWRLWEGLNSSIESSWLGESLYLGTNIGVVFSNFWIKYEI